MTDGESGAIASEKVALIQGNRTSFSFVSAGPVLAGRVVCGFLRRRSSSDLEKSEAGEKQLAAASAPNHGVETKVSPASWALEFLLLLAMLAASLTWRLRCALTASGAAAKRVALRVVRASPYSDSTCCVVVAPPCTSSNCCEDAPHDRNEALATAPAPAIKPLIQTTTAVNLHAQAAPQAALPCVAVPTQASRLTVCLDMDDTLVLAVRKHSAPYRLLEGSGDLYAARQHSILFGRGQDIDAPISGEIAVLERPHLHEFLAELKAFADVVLFTAGLESYAKPIVKRIDPEGKYFERVLYRDATVSANGRENIKDLKCIGQRMEKVVLVDNSPFSFMLQPNNGIPIKSFSGDAEDDELMTVTLPLLKKLAEYDDIRPVLAEQFNMVHWFARKGVVLPKGVTLVKPRV